LNFLRTKNISGYSFLSNRLYLRFKRHTIVNGNKNNKFLKENSVTKELENIVFIIIVFYNAIENLLLIHANQHSIFFLFIY